MTYKCPKPPHFLYFVSHFIFFAVGRDMVKTSNLVHRLMIASASPQMAGHDIPCRRCMMCDGPCVHRESLLRGLELMCICLAFFPPSSQFLPYLQLHLTCPLDSGIMRFTQVTRLTHVHIRPFYRLPGLAGCTWSSIQYHCKSRYL